MGTNPDPQNTYYGLFHIDTLRLLDITISIRNSQSNTFSQYDKSYFMKYKLETLNGDKITYHNAPTT